MTVRGTQTAAGGPPGNDSLEVEPVSGELQVSGYRVWTIDRLRRGTASGHSQGVLPGRDCWRLVTATVFPTNDIAKDFARDVVDCVVLEANVVPVDADAASRQCVRQSCNR
jgi:hypothetical protein